MKIIEIHVERLKSYPDYSNRSVRLVAKLEENEDVKEAYLKLAKECETLLEIQKIEADKELIESRIRSYEERKKELEKMMEEFNEIRSKIVEELRSLEKELEVIERLANEKQIKLSEKIIRKLSAIRRAIGYNFLEDPCDP